MQFRIWRLTIVSFCSFALFALVCCRTSSKKVESRPARQDTNTGALETENIVLITLDTVRPDHLHCYGDQKIKTPAIDALASSGVLFENAVAQTPLTEPSHASIFTGQNPNIHGVRDTGGFALQPSSVTLATILKRAGWDTAGFISAAVLKREFGFNQGFTTYNDRMPENQNGISYARDPSRPANGFPLVGYLLFMEPPNIVILQQ
jgi:arylsulfatase A-like enzyme